MSEHEPSHISSEQREAHFAAVFEQAVTPETGKVYLTETASTVLEAVLPYTLDLDRQYTKNELHAIAEALYVSSGSGDLNDDKRIKQKMDLRELIEDIFLARMSISAAAARQGLARGSGFQRLARLQARSAFAVAQKNAPATLEDLLSFSSQTFSTEKHSVSSSKLRAMRVESVRKAQLEPDPLVAGQQPDQPSPLLEDPVPEGMDWYLKSDGVVAYEPARLRPLSLAGKRSEVLQRILEELVEYVQTRGTIPKTVDEIPERLCLELGVDTQFPEGKEARDEARQVCAACAGRIACMLYALKPAVAGEGGDYGLPRGMYAGLSDYQRSQLKKNPAYQEVAPYIEAQKDEL